jgi:hypothetical protein
VASSSSRVVATMPFALFDLANVREWRFKGKSSLGRDGKEGRQNIMRCLYKNSRSANLSVQEVYCISIYMLVKCHAFIH